MSMQTVGRASWLFASWAAVACTRANPAFYDTDAELVPGSGTSGGDASATADTRHEAGETRADDDDDGPVSSGDDGPDPSSGSNPGTTGHPSTSGTSGGSSSDSGGPTEPCCVPSKNPGCAQDPELEACVCLDDPYCCDTEWDGVCVDAAAACGAQCPPPPGHCCSPQADGCMEPDVVACVCEANGMEQCCDATSWSAQCAEAAVMLCSACLSGNSCCVTANTPGCNAPDVVACVCSQDAFCCQTAWDNLCVEATAQCGFDCPVPTMDCCATSPDPGCSDDTTQACVCGPDPFCCNTAWDEVCVEAAVACGGCLGEGPCSEPHETPSCSDPAVVECVCLEQDLLQCCTFQWTEGCVDAARTCG
jgi:hypothetical protein